MKRSLQRRLALHATMLGLLLRVVSGEAVSGPYCVWVRTGTGAPPLSPACTCRARMPTVMLTDSYMLKYVGTLRTSSEGFRCTAIFMEALVAARTTSGRRARVATAL